jgi:type I restriction enzyme S subunit
MKWRQCTVEEIASNGKRGVTTGPFGTQLGTEDFVSDGPEVFGTYSLGEGNSFQPGGKKRISSTKFTELARFNVLPDDVLISRSGTVGKVCVVPNRAPTGIVSYHLIRVRLRSDACNPLFFVQFLRNADLAGVGLSQRGKGAIMDSINAGIVATFRVQLPPLPLQQKFAALVERVERLRAVQRESLRQADHLFASLLHHAFAGEQD